MKSHTVPRCLLDQFAYNDPITRSRRLWQYSKGRPPSGFASPTSATRVEHHFSDPTDTDHEAKLEERLNKEFEQPVHEFLSDLRYRTFVLSRSHIRKLTRYLTLLFTRSVNRRGATAEQIDMAIGSLQRLISNEEKLSQIAVRWTVEVARIGGDDVRKVAEKMIVSMRTQEHNQATYIASMEHAMARLDEMLDNGHWQVLHTTQERPFVIGDAPVITWQRHPNGLLEYGKGFATQDVEVVLPVATTACLHVLPDVLRTRPFTPPTVKEINEAQAAFSTSYCYADRFDPQLNDILQPRFGRTRIGFNAFSVRHRNYDKVLFEMLMRSGGSFRAP